jgi:hypothetical protein
LTLTPSGQFLVVVRTWSVTSLRLTWRQEARNIWRTGTSIFVFKPKVVAAIN